METITQNAALICGIMLTAEALARLCPKEKMLAFTKGLVILALLASSVSTFLHTDWDLNLPQTSGSETNPQLEAYVEDQIEAAAQEQWEAYLRGLLAAAGLEAKKIETTIDIGGESSIVLTKAAVCFRFESEAQRGKALLENVLGPETGIEVTWDGP